MGTSQQLRAESAAERISIFREGMDEPLLTQNARRDTRPYIHPLLAPDGRGVLTEDTPPHHPWQHGLYVGLNDVNGVGFWTENPTDGTFHPQTLAPAVVEGSRAWWSVETEWRTPDGSPLLAERQAWTLRLIGAEPVYLLDLEWTLRGLTDVTFGQYAYGGPFLRMPFRAEAGGVAVNSEGQENAQAEGQRARWVAVTMPIEGRDDGATIAVLDHPANPEHPVPWRVDYQLGIAPSRCIAGAWRLPQGEETTSRYRLVVATGRPDRDAINASWQEFATGGQA